jgi:3-oxoacyl-(acyl-carrier-protein) synthase
MAMRVQGLGWVTALGRDLADVWAGVNAGARPAVKKIENPFNRRTFPAFRVDPRTVADVARLPRLRRSSAISHFASAAALDALRDAGCDPARERLALVFASSNGGVIYTRRFFEEVSRSGTNAGSPLLFPETVYNAPASHIAALLGITGIATTLVNDATVGLDAISAASELLDSDACDRCLVVAAEEADWVLCEACATWRLVSPRETSGNTLTFGEGAASVLLGRDGAGPEVGPVTFSENVSEWKSDKPTAVVTSASGTTFDRRLADLRGAASIHAPRFVLGEAFAASTVMQVVGAALELRAGATDALVAVAGFQGQNAGLLLRNT